MRILQGYVSKSVMSFPFHEIYGLDDYNDRQQSAVFFGAYRYEDETLIDFHGEYTDPTIFWTGQDAIDRSWLAYMRRNVTAHPQIHKKLTSEGYECELVQPASFLNTVAPQQLGPKIYAYCPSSAPDYHGKKVLEELSRAGYEITIGDGSIPQHQWKYASNGFYNDIFVGLCLSEFAGGGTSIIEMGLRGIPVITNVFNLPNCIPWFDARNVASLIDGLKINIGNTLERLANDVWNELDHEHKWLEL